MTGRGKFLSLLGLALVITGMIAAGGILILKKTAAEKSNANQNTQAPINLTNIPLTNSAINVNQTATFNLNTNETPITEPRGDRSAELQAQALSRSFAERYGSYSSNHPFQNIKDLRLFMTERFWSASERLIAGAQAPTSYFGVTSRAVRVNTIRFETGEDRATFQVALQRRESRGEADPVVFYQPLTLHLLRSGGEWLVDEAAWEKVT